MNDSPGLTTVAEMKMPQVSIGMPVYNGAKFIRDALDSLLAQTFADFELIISDNASTDGTEAICREYAEKDDRIRYVRQAENSGPIANFKYVLDEAVGEYFMWAAADDLWAPYFLEKCWKMLVKDKISGMAMMAFTSTSRLSSLFNRRFDNPLSCISMEDREDRVRAYSMLPFSTHKDNLVYAVWRKNDLSRVLSDLAFIAKLNIIGASMNEYALAMFRGLYIPEVGFYKRYRFLPPGHFLDPVFTFVSRLKRRAVHGSTCTEASCGISSHLYNLKTVLEIAGFSDGYVSKILEINGHYLRKK